MNQKQSSLPSPYRSLRKLFEENIHVNHISEVLVSFEASGRMDEIKEYMERTGFDVVGIKEEGKVTGYLERGRGTVVRFHPANLVSESTPLIHLLYLFEHIDRIFILERNEVTRLVTLADLQKPPVRMLLFGIISLMEMHLLHVVKHVYRDGSWREKISAERLRNAEHLYELRKERNEEITLLDCLQLSDKKTLIVKKKELLANLGFSSRAEAERFFNKLERLRNNLAHSQELTGGESFREIIQTVRQCERVLEACEQMHSD